MTTAILFFMATSFSFFAHGLCAGFVLVVDDVDRGEQHLVVV
jgi:hypothetical protein